MAVDWRIKNASHFFIPGAMGGDEDKKEGEGEGAGEEIEEDPEIVEARREIEERRLEKHRKMEEERETMRQEIRDKVCSITHSVLPPP